MTETATTSPGALLRRPPDGPVAADRRLAGFAGFHGGLALGLLAAAMGQRAGGAPLRSITGRFRRPLDGPFRIEVPAARAGRRVTALTGAATGDRGVCLSADAVFGPPSATAWPAFTPAAPTVPTPDDLDVYTIPPEFVPIARYTEIRPVGTSRPYAGGLEPELTAWIRLVEDEKPPDVCRLVFLADALAPSYTAVLSVPVPVPTIELTVRPAPGLRAARSPWVLMCARTTAADAGGWTTERIDVWGPGGDFYGCADQLRLVTPGS